MSKKKTISATLLEIEAGMEMAPTETAVRFEIVSTNGGTLTPQVILDAVADMISEYYSISDKDWAAMDKGDLNS